VRIRVSLNAKRTSFLIIHSLVVAIVLTLLLMFPKIVIGVNWEFIKVWGPTSISVLFYNAIVTSVIFYLLGLLRIFTKEENK